MMRQAHKATRLCIYGALLGVSGCFSDADGGPVSGATGSGGDSADDGCAEDCGDAGGSSGGPGGSDGGSGDGSAEDSTGCPQGCGTDTGGDSEASTGGDSSGSETGEGSETTGDSTGTTGDMTGDTGGVPCVDKLDCEADEEVCSPDRGECVDPWDHAYRIYVDPSSVTMPCQLDPDDGCASGSDLQWYYEAWIDGVLVHTSPPINGNELLFNFPFVGELLPTPTLDLRFFDEDAAGADDLLFDVCWGIGCYAPLTKRDMYLGAVSRSWTIAGTTSGVFLTVSFVPL